MITEADTCRKYVLPKLYAAGWNDDQISEQKSFTDGRIVVVGNKARRRPSKRADYLLRYARDFMLAVVEAKAGFRDRKGTGSLFGFRTGQSLTLVAQKQVVGQYPDSPQQWLRLSQRN